MNAGSALDAVNHWVIQLGGSGLFIIALLDSSFLSFPQAVDVLIVILSTRHPQWMPLYVGLSTLGSVGGCLALFTVGRKGGELFLRRRFKPATVDRAFVFYRRWGTGAIAVPAMLPPPTPFKLLTLLAGAAGMHPLTFALSVAVGRIVRYLAEGLLAVEYGDRAWTLLAEHRLTFALALVALGVLAYLAWRRGAIAEMTNDERRTSDDE